MKYPPTQAHVSHGNAARSVSRIRTEIGRLQEELAQLLRSLPAEADGHELRPPANDPTAYQAITAQPLSSLQQQLLPAEAFAQAARAVSVEETMQMDVTHSKGKGERRDGFHAHKSSHQSIDYEV